MSSSENEKLSMAPAVPVIPHSIFAPSKAGPAAVEKPYSLSSAFITISPLVPISRSMALPGNSAILVLIMPAEISPPMCPPILGSK